MRASLWRSLLGRSQSQDEQPPSAVNWFGLSSPKQRKSCIPLPAISLTLEHSSSASDAAKPHRVEISVSHLVDVNAATKCLMSHLGCDDWFVACRTEHLVVVRLTSAGIPRYAVSFRCTPSVDKAIYHGNRAWGISLLPLRPEDELRGDEIGHLKSALAILGHET